MSAEARLIDLGICLPEAPAPAGLYSPFYQTGNLVFASGFIPAAADPATGKAPEKGKLGVDLTIEQGQEAARLCIINMLSAFRRDFGSLDRIKKVVKLVVFIQSAPDFYDQAVVANGASQLVIDIFGSPAPARSAIGMAALPLNVATEVEAVFEIE